MLGCEKREIIQAIMLESEAWDDTLDIEPFSQNLSSRGTSKPLPCRVRDGSHAMRQISVGLVNSPELKSFKGTVIVIRTDSTARDEAVLYHISHIAYRKSKVRPVASCFVQSNISVVSYVAISTPFQGRIE